MPTNRMNGTGRIKQLLLKTAVLALRIIYAPIRLLPAGKKVTIISRQSDEPSADIRMLAGYLQREHPDLKCVVLCRFIRPDPGSRLSYGFHMISQMKHIATSRVVVLDGYCIAACALHHKPETEILQMWHAVAAIKKFGYQTIDRPGGHSRMVAEIMCMHRNYSYVLCPSQATGEIFCEAFRTAPEKLLYLGLPRLDLLTQPEKEEGADPAESSGQDLRASCQIPAGKELLLYVPTFRRDKPVDLKGLLQAVDPARFVLAVRLHPLEEPPAEADFASALAEEDASALQVIYSREGTTEEWIRAADRIITDYSALAVEASLTGKPLYYYVYDIPEYEERVGLNMDPRQEMPGATAVTGEQLTRILNEPYPCDELRRFREKYITIDTEGCTARLGDFIYGIAQEIH